MKALRFRLSGKTAIFKKPEVNAYAYFTYNHIHKIALLGLLGACLGFGGYQKQHIIEPESPPEFYAKLSRIKVSVVPIDGFEKCCPVFPKKIQVFNNSVGYASKEEGGNLIVREQWLENPCWIIYILKDSNISEEVYLRLMENIKNNRSVYPMYLGKNDHPAVLSKCTEIELEQTEEQYIHSLFRCEGVNIDDLEKPREDELEFFLKEKMPITLKKEYQFYEYGDFMITNRAIENIEDVSLVYHDKEKELMLQFF